MVLIYTTTPLRTDFKLDSTYIIRLQYPGGGDSIDRNPLQLLKLYRNTYIASDLTVDGKIRVHITMSE